MSYSPESYLLVFVLISILLAVVFWPKKGLYYRLMQSYKHNDKIIIEDILKLLYHNQSSNSTLNTNDITLAFDYSNTRIIDSINEMMQSGLIYLEDDKYRLSARGNEYALQIIRAHRLWEKYLSEKTGFHKMEWHERAEAMEHKLDSVEMNKLSALLGNPKFDPHGDPIPTHKGKIAEKNAIPLSSVKVNSVGKIVHIEDEPEIIYKQILAENIHIYSTIRVIENNSTRVVFQSESESFVLAPIVAGNISIELYEVDHVNEGDIARLSSLKIDEVAVIVGLSKECRGESRRRLLDLGFVKGASIKIDLLNPLGDPKAYLIKGTMIALRNEQAAKILINKNANV